MNDNARVYYRDVSEDTEMKQVYYGIFPLKSGVK